MSEFEFFFRGCMRHVPVSWGRLDGCVGRCLVKIHMTTKSLTSGPRHHFFGFHDVPCSDASGQNILVLETDVIDRPPIAGAQVDVGIVSADGGSFRKLASTTAFNFPQGSRQQWVGASQTFTYICRVDEGWGATLMDLSGEVLSRFDSAIYAVAPSGRQAVCLNFSRLHRLGGYGYVGFEDKYASDSASGSDGISILDLASGKSELLVGLADIAKFGASAPDSLGRHYVTHVVYSPDGSKLAFLHRYWLPDGGLNTRLMTISIDGSGISMHAEGYLSHFDWLSNEEIMIWGRPQSAVDSMRSATGLKASVVIPMLTVARKLKRALWPKGVHLGGGQSYLRISLKNGHVGSVGPNQLKMDGHPMVNGSNRDYLVTDTYPNTDGIRDLMIYRLSTHERFDLGRYKMLDQQPDMSALEAARFGFDPYVLKRFEPAEFAFTRSGLHCDLHPRWLGDYRKVVFDSIHEGHRQVYITDVSTLLEA